jgi:hypothetical protein
VSTSVLPSVAGCVPVFLCSCAAIFDHCPCSIAWCHPLPEIAYWGLVAHYLVDSHPISFRWLYNKKDFLEPSSALVECVTFGEAPTSQHAKECWYNVDRRSRTP